MANLVISNGIAGLLSARWLTSRGIPFSALDAGSSPGQGDPTFAWRFRDQANQELFSLFDDAVQWETIGSKLNHRVKENLVPFDGDIDGPMKPLIAGSYRLPTQPLSSILAPIAKDLEASFRCNRFPTSLNPEQQTVILNDGSTSKFEKLLWAAPLHKLKSILSTEWRAKLSSIGKVPAGFSCVGFEWGTDIRPFPDDFCVVIPFRYKEEKLKAYGFFTQKNPRPDSELFVSHWITVPPYKLAANPEEIAKCVKALRREVLREFPDLETHLRHEKIIQHECFLTEKPLVTKSLEILPNVFYVGPELTSTNQEEHLWGLEVTLRNLHSVFPDPKTDC
jgi:hypothetical protein